MKSTMKLFVKERFKNSFAALLEYDYFKNKKSFAEKMEITPQFLSQLLNDNTPVPLEFLQKYFESFPVNPGYLFNRKVDTIFSPDAPHIASNGIQEKISFPAPNANSAISVEEMQSVFMQIADSHNRLAHLFEKLLVRES